MVRIVIQCAARKKENAGYLNTNDNRKVCFVASPDLANEDSIFIYTRPDDLLETNETWRDQLAAHNESSDNPLGLLPAYELYSNPAYAALIEKYGLSKIYILSAGWGLVSASYRLPYYDITFSQSADKYKRRNKKDVYHDFMMLDRSDDTPIWFLGGKDYIPLFCELTKSINCPKVVIYNSSNAPDLPDGFKAEHYITKTRTNWHYEFAKKMIAGNKL